MRQERIAPRRLTVQVEARVVLHRDGDLRERYRDVELWLVYGLGLE
jgi:hypothetical protein